MRKATTTATDLSLVSLDLLARSLNIFFGGFCCMEILVCVDQFSTCLDTTKVCIG